MKIFNEDNNRSIHKNFLSNRLKITAMSTTSIINGILYFTVAIEGGKNLKTFFKSKDDEIDILIFFVSIGASLVYTMFTYKTLESLSLKINSATKAFFSSLAPFSAAAFLTAGKSGAELLHLDSKIALSIGLLLFGLRLINCIDASVKFPERVIETKNAWLKAIHNKNYLECSRLIFIIFISTGYVASTTDAVFNASKTLLIWIHVNKNIAQPISYVSSIIGALGTLPLIIYWCHRGLRQLTFGGETSKSNENPDPTDRYTYFGFLAVLPVMLGILGAATTSTGSVFGQFAFSQFIRVTTSILYAACAGTPGMATLLRNISKSKKTNTYSKNHTEKTYLLSQLDTEYINAINSTEKENNSPKILLKCCNFFKINNHHIHYQEPVTDPEGNIPGLV